MEKIHINTKKYKNTELRQAALREKKTPLVFVLFRSFDVGGFGGGGGEEGKREGKGWGKGSGEGGGNGRKMGKEGKGREE